MAIATFIKTKLLDTTDQSHSIALVDLDGQEVEHPFWYSCIAAYGKEGTKQLICARVLYEHGFHQEAHAVLSPEAAGEIIIDENGNLQDQRNWQKHWIDDNPIISEPTIPDTDPLL
jgi:hypothetical protein